MAERGTIELICGCMFSGKTERLLRRLAEAKRRGVDVAAFKHASDHRYARSKLVTHSGQRTAALAIGNASRIAEHCGDAGLVVIDEAQFFGADLVATCRTLAEQGRDVIVAGLDLDSWGEPFGPMPALETLADRVVRTEARCARCGRPARRTQRLVPVETPTMIGGPEAYEPRCVECFKPPPAHLRR